MVSNYRPISRLSNLNKILEKLMFNIVYKFLDKQKCFYNLQFGFRKKHSTNHALIEITENIRKALDNSKYACGIFIDLQKTFDTVNPLILISKLNHVMELEELETTGLNHISIIYHNLYLHKVLIQTQKSQTWSSTRLCLGTSPISHIHK